MYIIYTILFILVAVFFMPVKTEIKTRLIGDKVNSMVYTDNQMNKNQSVIVVKIFWFIPIYKFDLQKNVKNKKKNHNNNKNGNNAGNNSISNLNNGNTLYNKHIGKVLKKIIFERESNGRDVIREFIKWLKKVKVKKCVFAYGFNTQDYVKNSYINASLNTIICMLINSNQQSFDLKRLYYQVYVSDYSYYLILNSIIQFNFANNIPVFKATMRLLKEIKLDEMRSEKDGRTSNRKFNDNSNEFA